MNISDYRSDQLTGWYARDVKPVHPGVFQLSRKDLLRTDGTVSAWCYSRWTGEEWQSFQNYGEYHLAHNFVWRGLNFDPEVSRDRQN